MLGWRAPYVKDAALCSKSVKLLSSCTSAHHHAGTSRPSLLASWSQSSTTVITTVASMIIFMTDAESSCGIPAFRSPFCCWALPAWVLPSLVCPSGCALWRLRLRILLGVPNTVPRSREPCPKMPRSYKSNCGLGLRVVECEV